MTVTERINKRVAQGRQSRAKILEAAIERFSAGGYAGTSVDDVCRSAGIVKSALYWHFQSKEGLLAAVLEETAQGWIDGILESVQQTGDPLERLQRALAGMRELVERRPALLRLLHAMLVERSTASPETREVLLRVFDRARATLAKGIGDAIGSHPPGLDTIAALVLAAMDGIFLQHQLRDDPEELDRVFTELQRTVVYLVWDRLRTAATEPGDGHGETS
jgi:AcrR family transcriptional regulator